MTAFVVCTWLSYGFIVTTMFSTTTKIQKINPLDKHKTILEFLSVIDSEPLFFHNSEPPAWLES